MSIIFLFVVISRRWAWQTRRLKTCSQTDIAEWDWKSLIIVAGIQPDGVGDLLQIEIFKVVRVDAAGHACLALTTTATVG